MNYTTLDGAKQAAQQKNISVRRTLQLDGETYALRLHMKHMVQLISLKHLCVPVARTLPMFHQTTHIHQVTSFCLLRRFPALSTSPSLLLPFFHYMYSFAVGATQSQ